MPTLIVRGVPEQLHSRLKASAKEHHRSLSGEVLAALEEHMAYSRVPALDLKKLPRMVFKRPFKVTPEWLNKAIKEGRQ